MTEVFVTTSGSWEQPAISLGATNVFVADPFQSDEARVGKCYNNVQAAIARHGGEATYGWALTDFGPHRGRGGKLPPPLYRRWLNHVLWRDPRGKVWEVTPNAVVDNHSVREFKPTEFILDATATFEIITNEEWYTRPARYLPVRPEGVSTADCLTKAQLAQDERERNHWLGEALRSIAALGFRPLEWKVEMVGRRMGSIWLIAE
jgi:hypothetical protein